MNQQTYLVTGAANGLGRAICRQLAAQKCNIILLDKDRRGLESLYDEITDLNQASPAIYPMNLAGASIEDYRALANTLKQEYGHLNTLIHNAVHFLGLTPFNQIKSLDWYESIQTNLNSVFLLSQSCLSLMQSTPFANLIFISDDFSHATPAYRGAYAVSKSALNTLMKVIAEETEDLENFKTFCFNPGFIETQFLAKIYPNIANAKLPPIETIANECLELCNSDKSAVNGKIITAKHACFDLQL